MGKMRNYAQSARYEDTPKQVKRREARNRARAKLARKGRVRKGDGLDVDHRRGIKGGNSLSNLRAISVHANRAYPRSKSRKQIRGGRVLY